MSFRDFVKKRYKLLRESEALGISILIHALIFLLMGFIVVSSSESVRDALKAMTRPKEKRKVEPPKPVVRPKDIPVDIPPPPPKMQKMQKLDKRMVVKKKISSKIRPKKITKRRKTKMDFKGLKRAGSTVRTRMHHDYADRHSVEGRGKTLRAIIEQFVVVQYQGGDWDCEFHKEGDKVIYQLGSIPNLINIIKRETDIDVRNEVPIAVRADSQEIHKSPFVYFTGHKNFTLTDAEVENLRTYIIQGGCIVANSSLPGRRSRFDVAFRREMKRVIPDHDLTPLPNSHELFNSFYKFEGPPEGMNYWKEPLEVIRIDDRIAVIYNLNDYGDLMLARLNETGDAIKTGLHSEYNWHWEGPRNWVNTRRLYANADDLDTVWDAYKFNINILAYVLTR